MYQMYVPNARGNEVLTIPHFIILLDFDEHIQLGPNQSSTHPLRTKPIIKTPFMFSSRCEDLIRVYS